MLSRFSKGYEEAKELGAHVRDHVLGLFFVCGDIRDEIGLGACFTGPGNERPSLTIANRSAALENETPGHAGGPAPS